MRRFNMSYVSAACLALLLGGCAETPSGPAVTESPGLIPADTVSSLGARGSTRADWVTRVGQPYFASPQDRFFAYQRAAEFRNVWERGSGARASDAPIGPVRDTLYFYQVVGVWFDDSGNVRRTRQFMAPCGSCAGGEPLMTVAELESWMRNESPRRE